MAERKDLPGFQKKRKILFDDKFAGRQRLEAGIEFMEAGRYDDALEFFARSDAAQQVREIAELARQQCNVPIFLRAKVVLKERPGEDELVELALRAMEAGRSSMAELAYRKAGRQEEADRISGKTGGEDEQTDSG